MVVDNLIVCLNNKRVGKLLLDDKGNLHFSYASSWLSDENSRPISLSLPLTIKARSLHLLIRWS